MKNGNGVVIAEMVNLFINDCFFFKLIKMKKSSFKRRSQSPSRMNAFSRCPNIKFSQCALLGKTLFCQTVSR